MNEVLNLKRHGAEYRLHNPGGRIGSKLVRGEPYERKLLDEIHGRHLHGSALDIGAHVGGHSLFLAAVCGLSVVAFEPDPRTFEMLTANLALNPGLPIKAYPFAAAGANGSGRLIPGMHVVPDLTGDLDLVRVDDMVDLDDLTVVKIDVEGAEADVLTGMTDHLARRRPLIYAEEHDFESRRSVALVLHPYGYRRTHVIRMGSPMACWEAA